MKTRSVTVNEGGDADAAMRSTSRRKIASLKVQGGLVKKTPTQAKPKQKRTPSKHILGRKAVAGVKSTTSAATASKVPSSQRKPVIDSSMLQFSANESNLQKQLHRAEQRVGELESQLQTAAATADILRKQLAQMEDVVQCMVCMERNKDTAFACGHQMCRQCSYLFKECPNCRQKVKSRITLF